MVSIIIAYLTEQEYLAEAIASALSQQGIEMELILVCNAPKDQGVMAQIPEGRSRVKLIHEPLTGSAHARNAGLNTAQGEWIQFLDVDDLLLPEKIHNQVMHENGDAIVSPHTYRYLNGKTENSKWLPDDIWRGLLNSGLGSTSSLLWKRQALLDVNGWNADYQSHQEYELLFRLMVSGKKILPDDHRETIVRQRKSGSITSTSKPVRVVEGIRLREAMWNHIVSHGFETPERFDAFRQYLFRQLRGLFRQDRKEAMALYKKYFSGQTFTPKEIQVPGYGSMYRMLGYYKVESILGFLTSIRDMWFK